MKVTPKPQPPNKAKLLKSRKSGESSPFLDHIPFPYFLVDSSGIILEANDPAVQFLGIDARIGRHLLLRQLVYEPDQTKLDSHLVRCSRSAAGVSTTLRLQAPGTPLVDLVSTVVHPPRSKKVLLHTIIHHHSGNGNGLPVEGAKEKELERLYRTLKALGKSSQAMLHAANESAYMNEVCRIVQEDCGHAMVWIGFSKDDEKKSIDPVAFAGFEEGYLQTLKLTWADAERGRGPTGTAVRTGQPIMCRNMHTDPQFAPWREEAIRRGYASSIALPLTSGERTFGAVMIYSREPDPFSEDEVKLLMELAGDLSQGLTSLRLHAAQEAAELLIQKSEERHRSLFEYMTEGFALHEIMTDSHGLPCDYRFLEVNASFERLTGLRRNDLVGKRVLEILPDNEPIWIERYGRVALTGEPVRFENFSSPLGRWYEVFAYRPAPMQFAVIFTDITGRKQIEADLRESRLRYQALIETTGDFIWETDAQGRYTYCSPQTEKLWGMKPAEMIGKTPIDHSPTEEKREFSASFFDPARLPQAFSGRESEACDGQGRLIYVETGGVPFFDKHGGLLGFRGITRDITGRKQAQKQLKRSTERFALLSETAGALLASPNPQAVVEELCRKVMAQLGCDVFFNFMVDRDARRLRLNACAGIAKEDVSTMQWIDIGTSVCGCVARDRQRIIVDDVQHTPDHRTGLIRSLGVQAYCCHPLMSGDEVLGTLSFASRTCPRFSDDEVELMRVVADQVSVALERLRTEKALRESEERLQDALRVSRSFTFDWFPATDRVHRSLSCAGLLGLQGTEAENDTGQRFFQRVDPADRERFIATLNALKPGADRYETKYRFMRPDGGTTILEESGRGFFDSEGNLSRLIGVSTDVTARERAEEALRMLNAQLEQRVHERTVALKKTTEALNAERQRFMDVLDVLPAYVILLSPDYRVPFANRFFEERFGKSRGRRCYEYLFNRTEPCETCETMKPLKTQEQCHWEWTGPDGRIYDISDFPFADMDGSKLVLEMGIDITERKQAETELERHRHHLEDLVHERTSQLSAANDLLQSEIIERKGAEEALQESEERFRLAIQHSKLMAWECDREMRFTWVYNSNFGFSSDELLGKTPAELGNEQGMEEFVDHGAEVLENGRGVRRIIRYVHAPEKEQYFDQQVEVVRGTDGSIEGLIGISLEVTDRVLAEQRLHKSEEGFRLMIGHSGDPMMLVDQSGSIDCISRKAAEQLGYVESELVGTSVERFLDWNGKLDLTMRLEDFLRHAPSPAKGVLRIRQKNGSWRWLDVHASFVNYGQRPEKYLLRFEMINTEKPKSAAGSQ